MSIFRNTSLMARCQSETTAVCLQLFSQPWAGASKMRAQRTSAGIFYSGNSITQARDQFRKKPVVNETKHARLGIRTVCQPTRNVQYIDKNTCELSKSVRLLASLFPLPFKLCFLERPRVQFVDGLSLVSHAENFRGWLANA